MESIAPLELAGVDVCFSAAIGFSMSDLLRVAAFSALHLNLALRAGEPSRIVRALAFEMGVAPGAGEEGLCWANRALPIAERLSERHGTAYHRGLFFLAQGHVAHLSGRWKAAVDWLTCAEELLRETKTEDVHWALLTSQVLSTISAVTSGDFAAAAPHIQAVFKETRQRGDNYRSALMLYPAIMVELARDCPETAEKLLEETARSELHENFSLRDLTALHCALVIDRYTNRESDAWLKLSNSWHAIENSKILCVNIVRITMTAERGSAALARAVLDKKHNFTRIAKSCIRRLNREKLLFAHAFANLLTARLSYVRNDLEKTLEKLTEATLQLDAAGLAAHAECARRVSGTLMGRGMGDLLVKEADTQLTRRGIVNIARFAAMMIPGFSRSDE